MNLFHQAIRANDLSLRGRTESELTNEQKQTFQRAVAMIPNSAERPADTKALILALQAEAVRLGRFDIKANIETKLKRKLAKQSSPLNQVNQAVNPLPEEKPSDEGEVDSIDHSASAFSASSSVLYKPYKDDKQENGLTTRLLSTAP